MLKRLKIKFILTNMLLITFVLIVCFGVIYFSAKGNIEAQSIEALETFVIIPENTGEKQGELNKPFENKSEQKNDFPYYEDAIINKSSHISIFCVKTDNSGNLLSVYEYKENLTASNMEILKKYAKGAIENNSSSGILKEYNLRYNITKTSRNVYISFLDMAQEQKNINAFAKGLYIVAIFTFFVILFISFILASVSIRPVEKAWSRQKQFIADASHELKTPLTVILASTDIMLSNKNELSKDKIKWLECTKSEALRMKELLSGMLYLARSDYDGEKGKKSPKVPFNLSDVLGEVLLTFEITCFEKGKNLIQDVEEGLTIKGNESEIRQLIGIFLDNACKYSNENGDIFVSLKNIGNKCVFTVKNTGEAIPEKDIPHLFERFYRASESRAREEGGYGLGLSIAQTIATEHDGKISVSSNENGTEFSVRFSLC